MSQEIIRVVVTSPVDEQNLQKIGAVSGRICVDQVSSFIIAEKKGDGAGKEQLALLLRQAEVLYGWIHHFPRNLPERVSRLRWIQTMTAGVDQLPAEILKSGIRISNTSGVHRASMGGGGLGR